MCRKSLVRASGISHSRSTPRRPGRLPCVIPTCRVLWLLVVAIMWMVGGYGGIASGQVFGVDDPSDMADSSGDIKRIEAWVEDGNLHLTMTVYGVFAPSVAETPAGMSNRYYYHWLLDTDNNPDTGYHNSEYEGTPTGLTKPADPARPCRRCRLRGGRGPGKLLSGRRKLQGLRPACLLRRRRRATARGGPRPMARGGPPR